MMETELVTVWNGTIYTEAVKAQQRQPEPDMVRCNTPRVPARHRLWGILNEPPVRWWSSMELMAVLNGAAWRVRVSEILSGWYEQGRLERRGDYPASGRGRLWRYRVRHP